MSGIEPPTFLFILNLSGIMLYQLSYTKNILDTLEAYERALRYAVPPLTISETLKVSPSRSVPFKPHRRRGCVHRHQKYFVVVEAQFDMCMINTIILYQLYFCLLVLILSNPLYSRGFGRSLLQFSSVSKYNAFSQRHSTR